MKLKNMILLAKSMINFGDETNSFVRYNEEFVKSGVCETEVLYESFHIQK